MVEERELKGSVGRLHRVGATAERGICLSKTATDFRISPSHHRATLSPNETSGDSSARKAPSNAEDASSQAPRFKASMPASMSRRIGEIVRTHGLRQASDVPFRTKIIGGGKDAGPHYTRPGERDGEEVPSMLLSGNHGEIRAWRERASRERATRSP